MNSVELDFGKPNPIQKRALDLFRAGKRIVLIVTGRQAGKSHFGARWTISQIAENWGKNKLGAVIAPTYSDSRVAVRKIKEVLQTDPRLWAQIKFRETPYPTFQFPNGYMLEVHSAHNPDSLRGPTFDFIWYDEVAKGSKLSFDIVMPTLLAANGKFLGTTTPRGKQNWIYDSLYVRAIPEGQPDHDPETFREAYGAVTGETDENVDNLSPDAVDELRAQYGEGSLFEMQELKGEFVTYKGMVYKWDEDTDYIPIADMPHPNECSHIVGALDFGWHPDPTAAFVLGYKNGVWYVFDGIYENRLLTNDLAIELAVLTQRYRVSTWYADSARPDEIADLRARGLPIRATVKPRIAARVREMAMFADRRGIKVSHRCPDVRNEFQTYVWPPDEKLIGKAEAKPVDKNNHAMDAIGYALWSMRYLWRNDPGVHINAEPSDDPDDDPDSEPIVLTERVRASKRQHSGPSGLYSK
jgi:phage terminase large subunit